MREELDKALCEKYPKMFKYRHADPSLSPMAWGFDCGDGWYNLIDNLCDTIQNHEENLERTRQYNINYAKMREAALEGDWRLFNEHYLPGLKNPETYAGWIQKQKEQLLGDIPAWFSIVEPTCDVAIEQIKEKFGGLRFYHFGGDEFVYGAVAMAERMSYTICEECGLPAKTRSSVWVRTLCDKHAEQFGYTTTDKEDSTSSFEQLSLF